MCVRSEPAKGLGAFAAKKAAVGWKRREASISPPAGDFRVSHEKQAPVTESSALSQLLRIIQETTQPIHVVAVVAALVVSAAFFPSKGEAVKVNSKARQFLCLLHLTAFATQFGAQIWMTFVSGLSLYFSMPRHIFGQIQRILFPLYFLLTGALSLVTIFTYSQLRHIEDDGPLQLVVMCACFTTQLFARLCLCPHLIRFMEGKHKMESMAPLEEISKCPRYRQYCTSFRYAHSATAVCNIFTMVCTTFQLYHLAQQLCI